MILGTTIFFSPSWPRTAARVAANTCRRFGLAVAVGRLVREPDGERGGASSSRTDSGRDDSGGRTLWKHPLAIGLILFFAVQLLFPMRYLLYPGNVLWHEQGFRFSWRVMLVEKTGHIEFTVVDEAGRRLRPDLKKMLTPQQEKMMSTQADMILQMAHYLRDRYDPEETGRVRVYAEAWVGLNGRPRARFTDPTIDLARQREGWRPKTWILPGPEPL